jgi:glycosyltransferase 2 family protein
MASKKWNKKLISFFTAAFAMVVAWLLYQSLSNIDWGEVKEAVKKVSLITLLPAIVLTLFNYTILSTYDFLGLRYLQEKTLRYRQVLYSAFICYAFNLNLGALVGGVGFRYRIYSGWKISKKHISLVVLFSTISNWFGYVFLVSMVCFYRSAEIKRLIGFDEWIILGAGLIGLSAVITYMILCFRGKNVSFRNQQYKMPDIKTAFKQLGLSCIQWNILSYIIFYFLQSLGAEVLYGEVLFAYLIAAIAGVLTHIPGGLGVVETVFLSMNFNVTKSNLLVALICFRACYYLFPLVLAIPSYLYMEYYQKKNVKDDHLKRICT